MRIFSFATAIAVMLGAMSGAFTKGRVPNSSDLVVARTSGYPVVLR
jgi:hypothetical protein